MYASFFNLLFYSHITETRWSMALLQDILKLQLRKKGTKDRPSPEFWGDSPRRGNVQGQMGKTEFKLDLRKGEGCKLKIFID
jgi:hypothetical protein